MKQEKIDFTKIRKETQKALKPRNNNGKRHYKRLLRKVRREGRLK